MLTYYAYFSTSTPLILCVIALNMNCQRSKLGYRRKKIQRPDTAVTAKITGCALKQGSETRSSLRQSNLQLQNEAALMSRRIRAVEH